MSKRIIKQGWINFQRNSYLSFAAVAIMSLALGLLIALIAFQFLTTQIVGSLENQVDITTYFTHETPEDQILEVQAELKNLESIVSVTYTSRNQAKEIFLQNRGESEAIQESFQLLDENPLRASLNILAIDPSKYLDIATFLRDGRFGDIIYKVDFFENQKAIETVQNISSGLNRWGLVTALVLAIVAVLVTFNTIRLTIYNQRKEIEIMRLVGASNWQIRGPYVVEGGYYGLFAGILSLLIMYPVTYTLSDNVLTYVPEVNLFNYFTSNAVQIILLVIILGITIGTISSYIAIRRHLRV